ncbi:MAG TPA: hypothetical protein PLU22_20160 [Polyangiaceae bacterium]|nr:hypothetical protein [Polyangiaceae bacterium]
MAFLHLVARAREGARPLAAPRHAWRLWRRLRAAFPSVTAAALMPDHLHLLLPANANPPLLPVLRGVLGGATRQLGGAARWTIAEPAPVADTRHLRRTVRYLHLNAPRAGLVADPLAWPWSTHRGALGAEADPWVPAGALAAALGRPARGFGEWLHGYVSGDPDVDLSGTPPPVRAPSGSRHPLRRVALAAASATPWATRDRRRHLTALLAHAAGAVEPGPLAELLEVSPRHVRRLAGQPDAALLEAGWLCLSDERLLLDPRCVPEPMRSRSLTRRER